MNNVLIVLQKLGTDTWVLAWFLIATLLLTFEATRLIGVMMQGALTLLALGVSLYTFFYGRRPAS